MSEWAHLPDLILSEIACCISVHDDFVNFGAVCKAWQRVYSMIKLPLSPRCPWLLLAEEKEQKIIRVYFSMYSTVKFTTSSCLNLLEEYALEHLLDGFSV